MEQTEFSQSKKSCQTGNPSLPSDSFMIDESKIIKSLIPYGIKKDLSDGSVVCLEGDTAKDAFIVKQGVLKVYKKLNGKKISIATLKDGDIFGEMSLFSSGSRTATVQAFGKCTIIKVSKENTEKAIRENPDIGLFFLRLVTTRLHDLIDQLYTETDEGLTEPERVIRFYSASKFRSRLSYLR